MATATNATTATATATAEMTREQIMELTANVPIYCASYAFSGVWAFSPEQVRVNAPKYMLKKSDYCSGKIWEARLADLHWTLWAFSPV